MGESAKAGVACYTIRATSRCHAVKGEPSDSQNRPGHRLSMAQSRAARQIFGLQGEGKRGLTKLASCLTLEHPHSAAPCGRGSRSDLPDGSMFLRYTNYSVRSTNSSVHHLIFRQASAISLHRCCYILEIDVLANMQSPCQFIYLSHSAQVLMLCLQRYQFPRDGYQKWHLLLE